MNKNPLEFIQKNDEELFSAINFSRELAFKESALPLKEKLLIALALDASHGAVEGVKTLAKRALDCGASKEEIMDTLRVTYFVSGVGSIYTAARALEELFS
jgi:alkylhydroperoxidase/carboxymuconolactone decarboxylase family protein YurZ